MAGSLKIRFNSLPSVGSIFVINVRYLNNMGTYSNMGLRSEFLTTRTKNYQVTIGDTVAALAYNFMSAFNTDHGTTGGAGNLQAAYDLSQPSPDSANVEIFVNNESWEFVDITGNTGFITYTITNQEIKPIKTAGFLGYNYDLSDCNTLTGIFKVTGGAGPYNVYVDGTLILQNQSSPIELVLNRNKTSYYNVSFTDSSGTNVGTVSLKTPPKLSTDKIGVLVAYTDQGATVSVNAAFVSEHLLPLSYSLDGSTYQEENVFTGQTEGEYTVYVKDAFGCTTSKNFTVDGFSTVTETNFELSDINPIRYSLVENGKKNRYNTLSHEQLKNIAYPFIQYFTDDDNPITQIKTNAPYLNIFTLDCDGSTTPLTAVQRSNHLGQTFKSTATKFTTEDGRLGVYFGIVDVLDILTNEVIESKDFGYQVPQAFSKIGGFVTLEGLGMVPINEITYSEDYEAFVLKFDIPYTAGTVATSVEARYNIQNYEIYEFVTPVSDLPDSFNVIIEAGQSASDIAYTFMSEQINKTIDSEDLLEIIYWHSKNLGGMNYATGVVHTLRLYSTLSRLSDFQTVEGYNGDVERYNTDNEVFDGEEFIFGYLSEEMVRKLRLILTHDRLFINGVHYRLGDDVPELTSRFTTNICELTAILRKGGDLTESFSREIIEPATGEGVDQATYELENAIATAKGKALILWKQ